MFTIVERRSFETIPASFCGYTPRFLKFEDAVSFLKLLGEEERSKYRVIESSTSYMGENLINAQIREARAKSRVLATMSDNTDAESTNPNDLIFTEPIVI